ncbi:VOC family protein [Fodinibius sediminis]|uniref:Catechol 2,3-dioxygenase n=1 Tax=Fodinibius sediminis TaxID=1214077 RepID=A0A521DRV5_9BACT|nr:VOC family protein [Fodinibius sediminis]SMO73610.1 Catechol 2,3-dioxygenase [Fodinibius sediminis]
MKFRLPSALLCSVISLFIVLNISPSAGFAQEFDTEFDHQALVVGDLEASAAFYKEVLGLKEIRNETGKPTRRWFSLGGELQLHLLADDREGVHVNKSIHLAVTVRNFDQFVENLRARNIPFTDWPGNKNQVNIRPDGIKQVYVKDPDGYSIEVNSRAAEE